jgi:hypothetical protein
MVGEDHIPLRGVRRCSASLMMHCNDDNLPISEVGQCALEKTYAPTSQHHAQRRERLLQFGRQDGGSTDMQTMATGCAQIGYQAPLWGRERRHRQNPNFGGARQRDSRSSVSRIHGGGKHGIGLMPMSVSAPPWVRPTDCC